VRRAAEADRAYLGEVFPQLCAIESPTGAEHACAERIAAELRSFGLRVEEDDAGERAGADCGNLYCRLPGAGARSLLLCAHMDTVPPLAPIEPVLVDGAWTNANEGVLGADNKAAVAVMLALARRLAAAEQLPAAGLELLFTVSEETGLRGAAAFDVSRLRSAFGYVFDHASPIGEVIVASPSCDRIVAEVRGRAAHAGLHPELGRSAIVAAAKAIARIPHGRLDEATTVNVGTIGGGSATNVVAERCRLELEARGLDESRLGAIVTEILDCLHEAADVAECDLDVSVERLCAGYRARPSSEPVAVAERALAQCGYEPRLIASGGGSDANALRAAGFECINLANGTERAHEPDERVSVEALEGMLEVAIALHELSAGEPEGGALGADERV
jgi:tripeptide aminopeptidase